MTVPTTRPRSASGARMLAKGIRIWTTTEVVAATPRAAASAATPGAAAASAIPAPLTRSRVTTSRRRSSRSPRGTRNTRPAAYATCVTVTSSPAAASEMPKAPAIADSSGCT